MTDADVFTSGRSGRRAEKKKFEEQLKAEERKKKLAAEGDDKKSRQQKREEKEKEKEDLTPPKVKCFGEEENPDFKLGESIEAEFVEQPCIWDEPISYELQVIFSYSYCFVLE
jgi:hypothetical protein